MMLRWSVALPTDLVDAGDELLSAPAIAEMAQALEAAGVEACHVTDHPYPPAQWVAAGGHHSLDPLVALTAAAVATTKLHVQTHVLVPGYRNPALVAHGLASLDAVSQGRVIAGFAVGYLAEEYAGLGLDHRRRGALLDDALTAIRAAWAGEEGELGNVVAPRPYGGRRLPIWIGGNSPAAIRRVVDHGDGWAPFPASERMAAAVRTTPLADVETLRTRIDGLRHALEDDGRTDPVDVCCTPFTHPHHRPGVDAELLLDEVPHLEAAGVTWATLRLGATSRAAWLEEVAHLGRDVIDVLAAR
jgi:probable F420-dependent oxidoreductase